MASSFSTNVEGKIHEIRLDAKKGYQALFEVISNSIFSINNTGKQDGRIDVKIERDPVCQTEMGVSEDELKKKRKVKDIIVVDNGEGFTAKNFDSFLTCYSALKLNKGGKGVGRFTCLKVFDSEKVESVYEENGIRYKRSFVFLPKNELEDEEKKETKDVVSTIRQLNSNPTMGHYGHNCNG